MIYLMSSKMLPMEVRGEAYVGTLYINRKADLLVRYDASMRLNHHTRCSFRPNIGCRRESEYHVF